MESLLNPEQLRSARKSAGFTQHTAAARLGISQAYLALMERGRRPVTANLRPRIALLYRLGPLAIPPCAAGATDSDSRSLAAGLAALGYPGFRRLARKKPQNPATLLLAAVTAGDLEVRVIEALPWLAVEYHHLDWEWLIREAKVRDAQNRLGFVVALARRFAEQRGMLPAAAQLRQVERVLDRSRLLREDTLCQDSLTEAERRWLRRSRPSQAGHWKLLTDLSADSLPYAARPTA